MDTPSTVLRGAPGWSWIRRSGSSYSPRLPGAWTCCKFLSLFLNKHVIGESKEQKYGKKKLDNAVRKSPVCVSLELIRTQEAEKTDSLSKDGAWMSHRRPPGAEARARAWRGRAGRLRPGPGMAPWSAAKAKPVGSSAFPLHPGQRPRLAHGCFSHQICKSLGSSSQMIRID